MKKHIIFILAILFSTHFLFAQDDLLKSLEAPEKQQPEYATATFKSTRVINSHSVELLKKNQLDFRISHRFGKMNS